MTSDDEVQRQLRELATRIQAIERRLDALSIANAAYSGQQTVSASQSERAAGPIAARDKGNREEPKQPQSLESRIGSQLLNRIGIFAVLIGMAWFMKLAFDRDWIGPEVRVLIGLASAAVIVLWSERFRRQGFLAFSYAFKALGTGIGYLSLWAVSSVYHLLPATVVFVAMAALTFGNALLAWRHNTEVLALYALAGGFATPALLSIAERHEVFLFSYLLLLNAGALALFGLRPWKRLITCAFAGTVLYYVLWGLRYYDSSAFMATLIFIGVFFAAFALVPFLMLRTAGPNGPATGDLPFLVAFPIANGTVAFVELMVLLREPGYEYLHPWAALVLSAAFLFLALRSPMPLRGLLSNVHLAVAVFFLAVAIPLEFSGCGVTLCWLGEALGLIAIARARGFSAMRVFGAAVLTLAALDVLLLEWFAWGNRPLPVLANPHFFTYLCACGTFACIGFLSLNALRGSVPGNVVFEQARPSAGSRADFGSWPYLAAFSSVLFNLTGLLAITLEIHHYWFCGGTLLHDFCGLGLSPENRASYASFICSGWYMGFGAALMAVGFWRHSAFLRWQALALLAFSIVKISIVDVRHLSQGDRVLSFLMLGALLLAVSFAYQKDWLALRSGRP